MLFVLLDYQLITTPPTVSQMINGLNGLGNAGLYFTQFFFDSSALNSQVNITLSPLRSDTKYRLYYVIGNEDPFETIQLGTVQSVDFQTEAVPVAASLTQFALCIAALILLLGLTM